MFMLICLVSIFGAIYIKISISIFGMSVVKSLEALEFTNLTIMDELIY